MAGDNRLIHTPEGVRDSHNAECREKLAAQDRILNTFYLYGHEHVQTLSFEYFDIFSKDRESASNREIFRFFDRNSSTLVLWLDVISTMARCVVRCFIDGTMPLRFCYLERTLKNNSSYQGRLKERAETGMELIGDDSASRDAEAIAMVIDGPRVAGLKGFQAKLDQVASCKSLLEGIESSGDVEEELNQLIESGNDFGVEELLKNQRIDPGLKQVFLKLSELLDSLEQIMEVRKLTTNSRALATIGRLRRVHHILEGYGLTGHVTYDLGILSKYHYHMGIIFKAYTYGTGDYIVTGGRYDKLLIQFGKDTPAVGFVIAVGQLMVALSRQQIGTPVTLVNTIVLCEASIRDSVIRPGKYFEDKGPAVQSIKRCLDKEIKDYKAMAVQRHMGNLLYSKGESLVVIAVDTVNHSADETPVPAYG